ncbi:restriction endonuclease [Actinomycetospora rhizophila]|uniref:Restriction endonuclease n=1 Tax=Actinomycetospora rhizophila TaxID=1416876 RepID=A0ABV9ZL81_9PSEU
MDVSELAKLTDYEFEVLCKDVFEQELGVRLEIFGRGRDDGIDLRHATVSGGQGIVIQCKHWAGSGATALLRHFRKEEAEKVKRLNPDRYIVATSAALTPYIKAELLTMLHPYLQESSDIWGANEIAHFLESHQELIRKHIRLWLTSSSILREVMQASVNNRTSMLVGEIRETIRSYVPTPFHREAEAILEDKRWCLITGAPGTGKTTLARALAASYLADGYDLIDASYDPADVDRAWQEGAKQVFYMDDFFGHTYLDSSRAGYLGRALPVALRRISRGKDKILILTSRDYITAEALKYEALKFSGFHLSPCRIDISELSQETKATILYNAVYFSNLSPRQRHEFSVMAKCMAVIAHPNFNPRLIEHGLREVDQLAPRRSAHRAVLANLDNPEKLWRSLVEEVLEEDDIALLLSIYGLGGNVDVGAVQQAWRGLIESASLRDRSRFKASFRMLENTMIREWSGLSGLTVSYVNPSVEDFLTQYVKQDPQLIIRLLKAPVRLFQLRRLLDLATGPLAVDLKELASSADAPLVRSTRQLLDSQKSGDAALSAVERCYIGMQVANLADSYDLTEEAVAQLYSDELGESTAHLDEIGLTSLLMSSKFDIAHTAAEENLYQDDGHIYIGDLEEAEADWSRTVDPDDFVDYHWDRLLEAEYHFEERVNQGETDSNTELIGVRRLLDQVCEGYIRQFGSGKPVYANVRNLEKVLDRANDRKLTPAGLSDARIYLEEFERAWLPPKVDREHLPVSDATSQPSLEVIEVMFTLFRDLS